MRRGFMYITAVIDWYSLMVLALRASITTDTDFCIEAVDEAIQRHGTPDIFNTDQDSQFTSEAFTGLLKRHNIRISMHGQGAGHDNVFVERLWKSVKYEEGCLKAYNTVPEAKVSIGRYFEFYNCHRPHSSLDRMTPRKFYFTRRPQLKAAWPRQRGILSGSGLVVQTGGASSSLCFLAAIVHNIAALTINNWFVRSKPE